MAEFQVLPKQMKLNGKEDENAPKLSNFELICQLTERSTWEIACSLPDKVSNCIKLLVIIWYTWHRTQRRQFIHFFLLEMVNWLARGQEKDV